jgi:hypothetical protein
MRTIFILFLTLAFNFLISQNLLFNYEKHWKKVDSLENKGLIKSALETVETIKKAAQKDNNVVNTVKAFIFEIKYKNYLEEDAFENLLSELSFKAYHSNFPYSSIYHTLSAELFWQYYTSNRFRFLNRTFTFDEGQDIKTWSLKHLISVTINHHLKALEHKEQLQKSPISNFKDLLTNIDNADIICPTLYDFVALRAVNFFSNNEITLPKPANTFILNDTNYFADAEIFINLNFKTDDTLSFQYYGLKILQDVLKFHLQNNYVEALIDADLRRLNFVYANTILLNKDSLYLNALNKLYNKFLNNPYSTVIAHRIINLMIKLSSNYKFDDSTTYKYKNFTAEAYNFAKKVIQKHHDAIYTSKIKNQINSIESPILNFNVENVLIPEEPFAIQFNFKNLEKIYVFIRSINLDKYEELVDKYYDNELIKNLLEKSKPVYEKVINLPKTNDYLQHSIEDIFKGLPSGNYIILASNNQDLLDDKSIKCYSQVYATNIALIANRLDNGSYKIFVVNRKTGLPIPNATITEQWIEYGNKIYNFKTGSTYKTDANGTATILLQDNPFVIKNYGNVRLLIKTQNESYLSQTYYSAFRYIPKKIDDYKVYIFTDRAIYRPGQKVYYKGILIKITDTDQSIVPQLELTITLKDANYQTIEEQIKTTNDFGTFNGTFIIPEGSLNGTFTIVTNYGSQSLKVEEYKRPKFYIETKPVEKEYYINDTVEIKAIVKSYTDFPLQGINVNYKITRLPKWRWYYQQSEAQIIAYGTVITDENGLITIKFKAISDPRYSLNNTYYQYKIQLEAIDINNEMQSAEVNVSAGNIGLFFYTDLKDYVSANNLEKIKFEARNINGIKVSITGTYNIYKLEDILTPTRNRLWSVPDLFLYSETEWNNLFPENTYKHETDISQLKILNKICTGYFDTKKDSLLILKNIKWKAGAYLLEILSKDSKGNDIKEKKYFTVYFDDESRIPNNEPLFAVTNKNNLNVGEKLKIIIGSAYYEAKVYLLLSYLKNEETYYLDLKQQKQKIFEYQIEEKHKGGINVKLFMVYNNRIYQKNFQFSVNYNDKKLNIVTETFRSKLYPGTNETWKIKITGQKSEKINSEILVSMYDKSLDAFVSHNWFFSPFPVYYSNQYFNPDMFSYYNSRCYMPYYTYFPEKEINYPSLNLFGLYYSSNLYYAGGKGMFKRAPEAIVPLKAEMLQKDKEAKKETTTSIEQNIKTNSILRKNFNETAFFFPQLYTNEKNEIEFTFKTPEALSKWRFMAFAHTKDLKYGFFENECVTQKEIMLTPQLPRFLRENDSIDLFIKIDNLTNSTQNITTSIKITDALNEIKEILSTSKQTNIQANKSDIVKFTFVVPENTTLVKIITTAQNSNFSDGEENILPVLPNKTLVTESFPFYAYKNQTKTFEFNKITETMKSNTIKNLSLTLEYTANPLWYAIMAIPYITSIDIENNEQLFNKYYCNIIAKEIIKNIPNFKNIFNIWLNDSLNKPLLSQLLKNEELKNTTLAETPWIQESLNETEQRKNIAKYFDDNLINKEINESVEKLLKRQLSNGAWSWFERMPENRYITQHILASYGKLQKLFNENKLNNAIEKAIKYIDNELEKDYQTILNSNKDKDILNENFLESIHIQYLYTRSFYLNKNKDFLESKAYKYFLSQTKKFWTKYNEYLQGMLAITFYRNNDIATAKDIIKSLKEKCVVTENKGIYWKSLNKGIYWTDAPIEAHSLLIEAFNEIDKDYDFIAKLKTWLILQKQTQLWETNKATINAIYALLLNDKFTLNVDFNAEIKWGDKIINKSSQNIEYATGYIKEKILDNSINNNYAKIEVSNNNDYISWGAIHWQYFENLDKITTNKNQFMSISRNYYIEKNTNSGTILIPIDNNIALKTGDKVIVRIVIECDRTLEFVHIKDLRPASFEPLLTLSGYYYKDGLGYYSTIKDASYNIFIDRMNKGKYVIEYPLKVTQKGKFYTGIATIQCMYAPEFNAHTDGQIIYVK